MKKAFQVGTTKCKNDYVEGFAIWMQIYINYPIRIGLWIKGGKPFRFRYWNNDIILNKGSFDIQLFGFAIARYRCKI